MPARATNPLSRSENMSRIRGKDTEPELILRRSLRARGLRFRNQVKTPGGKADLVIAKSKVALFVDGCFWHGCPEHYVRPRTSKEFWDTKLRENVDRDRRQTLALDAERWTVVRVWEHELREDPERVANLVVDSLTAGVARAEAWRVVRVTWLDPVAGLERRQLEELRDGTRQQVEERVRSTKKVGRVKGVIRPG
ncbi:MAG: very short patch repair endonuclease [Myxococcaceae bacterium]|nr:very short patch repair endonuclease [Myxococcaceae bacterium]